MKQVTLIVYQTCTNTSRQKSDKSWSEEKKMKANTVPVTEIVYTEDEWIRHMECNGKRIFKRWLRKQMIAWLKVIIAVTIILAVVTISGALADAIVRL